MSKSRRMKRKERHKVRRATQARIDMEGSKKDAVAYWRRLAKERGAKLEELQIQARHREAMLTGGFKALSESVEREREQYRREREILETTSEDLDTAYRDILVHYDETVINVQNELSKRERYPAIASYLMGLLESLQSEVMSYAKKTGMNMVEAASYDPLVARDGLFQALLSKINTTATVTYGLVMLISGHELALALAGNYPLIADSIINGCKTDDNMPSRIWLEALKPWWSQHLPQAPGKTTTLQHGLRDAYLFKTSGETMKGYPVSERSLRQYIGWYDTISALASTVASPEPHE